MQMLGPIISTYFRGLYDSLRLTTAFHVAMISQRTRKAFRRIIILNAPIFLGSMALMAAVRTIISRVFFDGEPLEDFQKSESLLSWVLTVLWIAPLYLIAFSFSSVAYNDISVQAYSIAQISLPSALPSGTPGTAPPPTPGDPPAAATAAAAAAAPAPAAPALVRSADPAGGGVWSVVVRNAEEVYRLFVVLTGLVLVFVLGALFGPLEILVTPPLTALIYGYYAFEYRWGLEGMPTSVRFEVLETRWPYFMGFGTILSAITVIFGPRDYAKLGAYLASYCTPARLYAAAEAGTAAAGVSGASSLICPVHITVARELLAGTFSFFFGTGMFALIFPVFILLAALAHPPKEIPCVRRGGGKGGSAGTEVPIVRLPLGAVRVGANWATAGVVKIVLQCCKGNGSGGGRKKGRSSRKEAQAAAAPAA